LKGALDMSSITMEEYRQMRPKSIEAFEGKRQDNAAILLKAKEQGKKIVGAYCAYLPREIVMAAGAIHVGLCGTYEKPIVDAEKELPRNLCPLIKSSYGLVIKDRCPYFAVADVVIGETTCDGKKKMFELLKNKGLKDIYVMQLPQTQDMDTSLNLWISELYRLKKYLENKFQCVISNDSLREAIHITNEENRVKQSMFNLNKRIPAVLSGMDMVSVAFITGFQSDRREAIRMTQALVDELTDKADNGYAVGTAGTKRILLTGTPVGIGNEKVVRLVEEAGALIVAKETCGGYKTVGLRIDENDPTDPIILLARKYLQIPCSVMTPNNRRLELLSGMIKDFKINGVIDLTWQACHTYNVEAYFVQQLVEKEYGIPYLHLETDYSQSDLETLRVRIEAFLEMTT
jgi:benzoyl-CoA reductase/2-hydroxyglutaryl-CoA dehydratase subunit BcrC/BadD/HgdB